MVDFIETRSVSRGRRRLRSLALLATLAALPVVLLVGCTPSQSENIGSAQEESIGVFTSNDAALAFAEENGYALMASILADGTITRDEYVESYQRYESCAEDAGFVFEDAPAVWNPIDNRSLNREVRGQPSQDALIGLQDCNAQHAHIAAEFSLTESPRTDPALLSFVIECLNESGDSVQTDGVTSIVDLVRINPGSGDGDQVPTCVGDGMKAIFPEIGTYTVAF